MKKSLFGIKDFVFISLLLGVLTSLMFFAFNSLPQMIRPDDNKLIMLIIMFVNLFISVSSLAAYFSRKASKWHFDRLNDEEKQRASLIDRIITVDDLIKIRRHLERDSLKKTELLAVIEQKIMLQG